MSEADLCAKIVIEVLRELKDECKRNNCWIECPLYDKEQAQCLLHNPCDYDIERIEAAVYKIIEKEIKEKNE